MYSIVFYGTLYLKFLGIISETETFTQRLSWIFEIEEESDATGADAQISYSRQIIGKPKSEVRYLIEANSRKFVGELTSTLTFTHSLVEKVSLQFLTF